MRLLLLLLAVLHSSRQDCSWNNCHKWSSDPNVINVHLATHTHDDMGWLKTVDEYFWGSKQNIVPVGVQYIYDTVIAELEKSPDRRFSFAETGFFYRWWISNSAADQQRFAKLVANGQLEFVGGGWTQNDEAAAHYVDIVDQMTYGLKKLNNLFGECGKPKVAWQIDPFGHSREMANMFALIGYEALFFWRIHYLDKKQRLENKTLEFMWNGSDDYKSQILTGAFFQDNYNPPDGFCFDMRCNDDPIMDNPNMEGYNVDKKVDQFVKIVKNQAAHMQTNHVLLTMGSDFHYANANEVFRNLDRLIAHINESTTGVRVFYSTPSCYMQGLQAANVSWTTKTDDFFPHANADHSFWTGYYTSRPSFKGMIREASSLLQLAKRLDAVGQLGKTSDANVDLMSRASALCQHHDAVTGTAKQAVSDDYYLHLDNGFKAADPIVNDFLSGVMNKNPKGYTFPQFTMCHTINETVCTVLQNVSTFAVTVFNPMGQAVSSVVMVPYYSTQARVVDDNGTDIDHQVLKTFQLPLADHGTKNIAPSELSFMATVPALGYKTYTVYDSKPSAEEKIEESQLAETENDPVTNGTKIENDLILLTFDANGYLASYTDKTTNLTRPFRQEFFFYHGMKSPDPQPSGAYIFRPNPQDPFKYNDSIVIETVTGTLTQEVRQIVSPWVHQVIRLKKNSAAVEFEWTVGPIPKELTNPITKEVVTRYTTDIQSNNVFYTDASGRQMMRREVNKYPSSPYDDTEPTAGNYYPITNRIFINDNTSQMTVLTDRSHGGSSRSGMIEVMLHRRCFSDDHYGVDEALNEPGVDGAAGLIVKGVHTVLLTPKDGAAAIHRPAAIQKFNKPVLAFAPLQNATDFIKNTNSKWTGMQMNLPPGINLLSLEHWDDKNILVRFENLLQSSENGQTIALDLSALFNTFSIYSVKELRLGANRPAVDPSLSGSRFTIEPQEFKTFLLQIQPYSVVTSPSTASPSPSSSTTSIPAVTVTTNPPTVNDGNTTSVSSTVSTIIPTTTVTNGTTTVTNTTTQAPTTLPPKFAAEPLLLLSFITFLSSSLF